MHIFALALAGITALTGCAPAEGNFTGQATYADAARTPVSRDDEPEQGVTFTAEFGGTATFGDLEGVCIPTDGSFTGTSSSEGTMDSDGNFAGQVDATGSANLLSSLGCVTESLDIEEITSITIKASIVADTENCSHYCEADASAQCEGEAGDDSAQAECESEAAAACTQECTTERSSIVAETTIESGAQLDSLNQGLDGKEFGSFEGDLTFESME